MTSYRIVPKRDFGSGSWIKHGFVVTDGTCNIMPGATWFETVPEAMRALRIWIDCAGDARTFWERVRRVCHLTGLPCACNAPTLCVGSQPCTDWPNVETSRTANCAFRKHDVSRHRNQDEETSMTPEQIETAVSHLRDLADRLMHVPVVYGTDQSDVDTLLALARMLEETKCTTSP